MLDRCDEMLIRSYLRNLVFAFNRKEETYIIYELCNSLSDCCGRFYLILLFLLILMYLLGKDKS